MCAQAAGGSLLFIYHRVSCLNSNFPLNLKPSAAKYWAAFWYMFPEFVLTTLGFVCGEFTRVHRHPSRLPSHVCGLFSPFPGVGETKHRSLTGGGPASSLRRRLFTAKLLLGCARNSPVCLPGFLPLNLPLTSHTRSTGRRSYSRGDELIICRVARSVFTSPFSHGSAHLEPLSSWWNGAR